MVEEDDAEVRAPRLRIIPRILQRSRRINFVGAVRLQSKNVQLMVDGRRPLLIVYYLLLIRIIYVIFGEIYSLFAVELQVFGSCVDVHLTSLNILFQLR